MSISSRATVLRVKSYQPLRRWLRERDIYIERGISPYRFTHVLTGVLRSSKTDLVVDVGANKGQFVSLLRDSAGWKGPVLSIEPIPSSFAVLSERCSADPGWSGINSACGETNGTATMGHHPGHSELDSLSPSSGYGRQRFRHLQDGQDIVSVSIQRLDEVIWEFERDENARFARVHLKIDTQGHDLAVLRGASGVLQNVASLQVELPSLQIYDGLPTYSEAVAEVMSLGFDPVGFFPVGYDLDGIRPIEFDGLFVRRPQN